MLGIDDAPPALTCAYSDDESSDDDVAGSYQVSRAAEDAESSQQEDSKWYEMLCGEDYDALAQASVASVDTTYGPRLEYSPLLNTWRVRDDRRHGA